MYTVVLNPSGFGYRVINDFGNVQTTTNTQAEAYAYLAQVQASIASSSTSLVVTDPYDKNYDLEPAGAAQYAMEATAGGGQGAVEISPANIGNELFELLLKFVGAGTIVQMTAGLWQMLPGPVKVALAAVGVVIGGYLLLRKFGIVGGGGGGGQRAIPSSGPPGGTVVRTWTAADQTFYRLADGRIATQKRKTGVWKFWRPKRPVVLFAGGHHDLKSMLRADKIIQKEAKRLKKMLSARGLLPKPAVRRNETVTIRQGNRLVQGQLESG